jgi:hypothetical protein
MTISDDQLSTVSGASPILAAILTMVMATVPQSGGPVGGHLQWLGSARPRIGCWKDAVLISGRPPQLAASFITRCPLFDVEPEVTGIRLNQRV